MIRGYPERTTDQGKEQVLSGLEPELKMQVTELLRYEENVAGGRWP
jgi:Mg/Co/Ni transporter MgtE